MSYQYGGLQAWKVLLQEGKKMSLKLLLTCVINLIYRLFISLICQSCELLLQRRLWLMFVVRYLLILFYFQILLLVLLKLTAQLWFGLFTFAIWGNALACFWSQVLYFGLLLQLLLRKASLCTLWRVHTFMYSLFFVAYVWFSYDVWFWKSQCLVVDALIFLYLVQKWQFDRLILG